MTMSTLFVASNPSSNWASSTRSTTKSRSCSRQAGRASYGNSSSKIADALVRRIADLRLARPPGARVVVGIVGGPGSGKSTVSEEVRTGVERNSKSSGHGMAPTCVILPMDGFHYSRSTLDRFPDPSAAHARRGAPFTFDAKAFVETLQRVQAREFVYAPAFEHHKGDPEDNAIVIHPDTSVVLVEGSYLLLNQPPPWNQIREILDEAWFLDVPIPLAMSRLVRRHMRAWQISKQDAEDRVACNDRLNADLVSSSKRYATFLVDMEGRLVRC
mmetsp:Transcript_4567/g.9119  ORF Transcript_4567/g.9119 Transcript_4567/m.9119 type:complete len:272 (-) Transcript_4567:503-1318(-)